MRTSSPPHGKKATSTAALDVKPKFSQLFKYVGRYSFCRRLQGYHDQVVEAFAKSFDCVKAQVGLMQIQIDMQRISRVTEIPMGG